MEPKIISVKTRIISNRMYVYVLTYISFGLLFLSCADDGMCGSVAKLLWLFFTVVLSVISPGSALGTYIACVAIYNVKHLPGWGSPLERPDNFAFPIVLCGLIIAGIRKPHAGQKWRLIALAGAFVGYGLIQMVSVEVVSRSDFAWFMRAFALPFMLMSALIWARLSFEEVSHYANAIAVLAAYIVVTCLCEAFGMYDLVIPHWIADPQLNVTIGIGRVGGPLLQSEWNALALGLIFCILLGTSQKLGTVGRIVRYVLASLCGISIYLTYTRASWIALAAASFVLIWQHKGTKRFAFSLVAVVLIAATILLPTKQGRERLKDSNTAYFRINMWAAGLEMARAQPLFGYGFGEFTRRIAGYKGSIGSLPETSVGEEGTVAHNALVSILVEEGTIGLVLYCLVVLFVLIDAKANTRRMWPDASALITAISLTYFISTMFVPAHEPTTNFLYYGTMGLLAGLSLSRSASPTKPNNVPIEIVRGPLRFRSQTVVVAAEG